MDNPKNDLAEFIRNVKYATQYVVEVVSSVNTPIPEKEFIISYKGIRIDQTTARCWYKGREYRPNRGGVPYIVLNLLVYRMGKPVSYKEFIEAIKRIKGTETIVTKSTISSAIREWRRKFNINTDTHPENDVFLATGNGYELLPE